MIQNWGWSRRVRYQDKDQGWDWEPKLGLFFVMGLKIDFRKSRLGFEMEVEVGDMFQYGGRGRDLSLESRSRFVIGNKVEFSNGGRGLDSG